MSEAYERPAPSATAQSSLKKDKAKPGKNSLASALLESSQVLQVFVEAQLFIFDVFRSLRVILHQQIEEAKEAKEEAVLEEERREGPGQGNGLRELPCSEGVTPSSEQPGSLGFKRPVAVECPRIEFPSLAEFCDKPTEPSSCNTLFADADSEVRDSVLSPPRGQSSSSSAAPSCTKTCVLDASKVPAAAMALIKFYREKIFDDMLPESIHLRITPHLHGLSASAALQVLRPRVHPLAIPVPAVSVAIGESGGRPWKIDWVLYVHEAIKDPVLLGMCSLMRKRRSSQPAVTGEQSRPRRGR